MTEKKQFLEVGTSLIPCVIEEMNLKQYVKVSTVVSRKDMSPEIWEDLFEFLGAKKSELAEMEIEDFGEKVVDFVKSMNNSKPTDLEIKDIEIDGKKYSVDLKEDGRIRISNILRKKTNEFVKGEFGSVYGCAIFFQDKSKNSLSNMQDAEIERRFKVFSKANCMDFIPFMGNLMKEFADLADKRLKMIEEVEKEDAEKEVTE